MTAIIGDDSYINLFINNPGGIVSMQPIVLKSQFSQTTITISDELTVVNQNERYAHIRGQFSNTDINADHKNGYYTWTMGPYTDIVKLIFNPGGDLGVTEYTSNNENREADVYYRPEY